MIASDLDGTLFNNQLQLPDSLTSILKDLKEKDIHFATASGRNWATQKEFFQEHLNEITFICDNGAFIVQNQKPIFISEISHTLWISAVNKCATYGDDCRAILCGVNGTYILEYRNNPELCSIVNHFYKCLTVVPNFQNIQDCIFKISICYTRGTGGDFLQDFFDTYSDQANVLRTHTFFMDIMNHGISKGSGLQIIQNQLNILPSETVVFGDFENDISLFEQAEYTFLMENAPTTLRKYVKYIAPSNEEEGVTEIIKQYIL